MQNIWSALIQLLRDPATGTLISMLGILLTLRGSDQSSHPHKKNLSRSLNVCTKKDLTFYFADSIKIGSL